MPASTGAVSLNSLSALGAGLADGFSESAITKIFPPTWDGSSLALQWESSSPSGTWFQVYLNNHLAWFGTSKKTSIVWPQEMVRIAIGAVGTGQQTTNFSSAFEPIPDNRVRLEWEGGTFEALDIAGFHVYGSPTVGADVSYTTALADIPAYPGGIILDGFGLGKYGDGGWGEAGSYFNWTSSPLPSGLWTFGVKAYDKSGNESTTVEVTELIEVAPTTMPVFSNTLSCLNYVYYNGFGMGPYGSGEYGGEHTFVLNWLPTTG